MIFLMIMILLCNIVLVLAGIYAVIAIYRTAEKYNIVLPFMAELKKRQAEALEKEIQAEAYTRILDDISEEKKSEEARSDEIDLSDVLDELPGKAPTLKDTPEKEEKETLLDVLEYGIPESEWNALMGELRDSAC